MRSLSTLVDPQTLLLELACFLICMKVENFYSPLTVSRFETWSGESQQVCSVAPGLDGQQWACTADLLSVPRRPHLHLPPPSRETIPGPGLLGCRTFRPSREIPGQTGTRWSPYSSAAVLNFHPIPSQPRPSSSLFLPRSSLQHLTLRSPLHAYAMSSSTPDAREQAPSFCVRVCPPGCVQDPTPGSRQRLLRKPGHPPAKHQGSSGYAPFSLGFSSWLSAGWRSRTCRGTVHPGGHEEPHPPSIQVPRPRGQLTEL